jgi:DNA-binding beta-propeller fold protein YncE
MKTAAILMLCSAVLCVGAAEPVTLRLTKTIPLPGVNGRFDHFAEDVKGKRLFVAALGNDTLEVLDVAAGKHVRSITGLHMPTGVVFLPELNQIGVANGTDGTFKVFEGTSYELINNVRGLEDADNARFDAKTKLIYNGYGDGALAIIDSTTMKQTGNIKLAAHPESFQLETKGSRIFVNVPDAKQIAVIDREKRTVTATWPMDRFQANFPMALDEAHHRLFVGCRRPARLVVFDTATGRLVTDLPLSGDTDDLFYDGALERLYISCGEGFVDVIDQIALDHYELRERIPTRAGARTSFFSAALNEYFVAFPKRGSQDAEIQVFQLTH